MKKLLILLAIIPLSLFSQTSNNCNGSVSACTSPLFPINPPDPNTNIVDFSSPSISNISNPNVNPGVNGNAGCLLSGETSSTFLIINVATTGSLEWSIIGQTGSGFFDWIMWPYTAATCAGISGNTLPPVACNWNASSTGNTGMASSGQLPAGGVPGNYEAPIAATAGQQFLLCLSNYSSTSQNVDLNFFGSAHVTCDPYAPDQTICSGSSATVNITTPNMVNPQFQWLVTNGVSNTTGGSNVVVSPSQTTTYTVQVTSQATPLIPAFVATVSFTITVLPPLTPNAGIDDTVCFGTPILLNGSVSSPTNGHTWSYKALGITPVPVVTFSPNFSNLATSVSVSQPGNYLFILKETKGSCFNRDTVKIHVKKMNINTQITIPTCYNYSDGKISLSGNNAQEFSFDNGITWSTDSIANGLAAGTYSVCVRDNNLCQACSTIVISNPAKINVFTSNDTLICQNGTAYLTASATGGTSYLFHWTGIASTNDSIDVEPIADSIFYVQAESEIGCLSDMDSIIVTVRPPISGIISPQDTICPGYPATLSITGNGGFGAPYNFLWSNGQTGSGASNTIYVTPPTNATFSVTITDACESSPLTLSTSVVLAPLPIPQIAITDGLDKKCEIANFDILNMTDTTMVQSVIWNVSNGFTSSNIDTLHSSDLTAGLYDIQLIVTSPQGCIDSTTFNNFLTVHPQPVSLFKFSPNPVYMFNTQVNFTNYSTGAESFIWNIEQGSPAFSQLENPSTLFPDGQTGEYIVSLEVTSEFGCKDTLIQKVVVMPEVIIYAPNTFTPDNDEHNQNWGIHIEGIDVSDFNLLIFNRWGEIIWESNDPSATWDGSYNGSIIPQGTYSWIIRAKDLLNDGKYEFNGYINILR